MTRATSRDPRCASTARRSRTAAPTSADGLRRRDDAARRDGRRRLRLGDRARRDDQGQVAEGLREVADLALSRDVVLLGEQAQVVRQAGEPLEQLPGLWDAPDRGE